MKTNWLLILIVCCTAVNCIAQDSTEVLLHIPKTGKSVSSFIPKGYKVIMSEKEDFNRDGKADKVIIAEASRPQYRKYAGFDRLLLILFGTKTGWELAGKSAGIMLPADMNNDPMIQIDAKGNTLEILQITFSHLVLSNFKNVFKYRNGDFYLVHRTNDSSTIQVKCEKYNEYRNKRYEDIDYTTGVRVRKRISYYCELLMDKKDTLDIKPVKLSEVKTE